MRLIRPSEEAPSIQGIDYGRLWREGIRAVLFDLDNTLCLWRKGSLDQATKDLLRELRTRGFRIAVLTNAQLPPDSQIPEELLLLGIPIIERARKPLPFGFRRALRALGVNAREALVIGDQLLTDVLGGKVLGLRTVLVPPLSPREARRTRVNRVLERLLGRCL